MARLTLWRLIREQCQKMKPVVKVDLTGKTVIITGANVGLGFEAAKHFATMNPARLILACRNSEKGKSALSKLSQETGYSKAEIWLLDLGSFASVREFADRFEREGGGRLDILVENAGISSQPTYEKTVDGYATLFQTNDISPSLHTLLLLPYMIKTAEEHNTKPRIVVVSSSVHYWAMDSKALKFANQPNMIDAMSSIDYFKEVPWDNHYNDSKLLNIFFVRALQDRLANNPSIIVNAICPGYCYSEFRRQITGIRALLDRLMETLLAFTTEEGSRHLVYGAVAGSGSAAEEKFKGGYIALSQVVEPSDFSISKEGLELEQKYWNELVNICKGADPRVKQVVEQYLQN
ncbi:NAD(P)-binding protein [Gymnopus androsaceus JB14]|uniref:NAD(P)-binding protein n=1 Tax=Gymnopus androsaceus JB14 TaxID=1447944 RepID=A0A6A4IHL6_9AGAR|nr:NAD(P)-binding protein [Gymnopus androsaceus JB14]